MDIHHQTEEQQPTVDAMFTWFERALIELEENGHRSGLVLGSILAICAARIADDISPAFATELLRMTANNLEQIFDGTHGTSGMC